jgi:exopolysaccharide production protein ExoQ
MSYIYFPRAKSRTESHRFPWLLFLFVGIALLAIFQWPLQIHSTPDDYNVSDVIPLPGSDGPVVREVLLLALCTVAVVSLVKRPGDPRMRIEGRLGWLLIAFLVWALMSILWTQDLSQTFKRLTSFVILCVFAAAVVRRLSLRELLLWTFFTTSLFLVIAIAAELISGIFQPFVTGYRFSGVQHPNTEGMECAFLAFAGFVAANTETRHRRVFAAVGVIAVCFLVLTVSRTTLAATALALAVYFVTISRRNKTMIVPVLGLLVSIALLVAMTGSFEGLNRKLFPGRDIGGVETFAGRSSVWQDVIPYIRDRPLQGYGYGGFWTPRIVDVIADKEDWAVPNAHSTYIDYFLALGAVGGILYIVALFSGLQRAFSFSRRTRDPHYAFLAGILIFCMVDGCLESSAGEVTLLSCLTIIALIRLAFLPLRHARTVVIESGVRNEDFYLANAPAGSRVLS